MAELSHDSSDEAFHEIQLSGKQLVFLFMATTVISVVIFLCGVLVGRGVRAEDIGVDPAVAASSDPAPTGTAATLPEPVATDAPSQAAAPPPLSYHQRLESEKTAEELKATAPARTEPAAPPPPAAEPPPIPASVNQGARPGTWAIQVQALRDRDAAAQVVQRLRSKGYPAFLVVPTLGAPTQLFRIQVGRFTDRSEAQRVEARLRREEQFDTFIVR